MTQPRPVRVLVAEDSELFAQTIVEILETDRTFEVFGIARDGREAVRMTALGKPDIVLMDLRMPGMDGLGAIELIMERVPTPILVMTSDPQGQTGELSFEALRRGALDLIPKPSVWAGTPDEQADLKRRLLALSSVPVVRRRIEPLVSASLLPNRPSLRSPGANTVSRAVGLVASTGGPPVLARVLSKLPADFPFAIIVVQHLSDGFTPRFASWLDQNTQLTVQVAHDGALLAPGVVLVAPDAAHVVLRSRLRVGLETTEPLKGHRPSGTVMLRSLARAFGRHAIAGVLTGMGSDGAQGLLDVSRTGGLTFVQDRASSIVTGMPDAARALGATDHTWTSDDMVENLLRRSQPRHRGVKR